MQSFHSSFMAKSKISDSKEIICDASAVTLLGGYEAHAPIGNFEKFKQLRRVSFILSRNVMRFSLKNRLVFHRILRIERLARFFPLAHSACFFFFTYAVQEFVLVIAQPSPSHQKYNGPSLNAYCSLECPLYQELQQYSERVCFSKPFIWCWKPKASTQWNNCLGGGKYHAY